jgi:hypothetical protein
VWVRDGIAYSSEWGTGVVAVDVGNGKWGGSIEKPVLIGTYPTTSGATHEIFPYVQKATGKVYLFLGDEIMSREGRVWEGTAYMQDLFGDTPKRGGVPQTSAGYTHIVDFTDPAHPKNIAKYHQEEFGAHDIIVEDDVMYQAYYDGGVRIVDVSGELVGNLAEQRREIAVFKPFDPQGFTPNASFVMNAMPWKGHVLFTDFNGLWAAKLGRSRDDAVGRLGDWAIGRLGDWANRSYSPNRLVAQSTSSLPPKPILDSRLLQQPQHQPDRQPHHAEEVAIDPLHQGSTVALDAIGAGLVQRLASGDVGLEQVVVAGPECHRRDVGGLPHDPIRDQGHRGDHLVGAALQLAEHAERVRGIHRLLVEMIIEHHGGVGAKHERPRHRQRLLARQPLGVAHRCFSGLADLLEVRWPDVGVQPQHPEQQEPAGRSRGEDQLHFFFRASRITFSISSVVLGAPADSTSWPVSVTRMSSSIRTPNPSSGM